MIATAKLRSFVVPVSRPIRPEVGRNYRQLGVRLWGAGAYERELLDGGSTQYAVLNMVADGDIVVNKIWARNGSVAVAHSNQAGAVVSGEFPLFEIDRAKTSPEWVRLFTRTAFFWNQCDEKSRGTSGKNRIKPEQFLDVEIPLPSIDRQSQILSGLDSKFRRIEKVRALRSAQVESIEQLLSAQHSSISLGAARKSLADVAPISRRPTEVDLSSSYPQVSARSFGRGTFHKEALKGSEITWQKPYRVEVGDVLISNIKAWEGAVAVALPEDHNRFGSHRYLTLVPQEGVATPEYLVHYLLSPEGLHALGEASPGSADRNRTLGTKALLQIEVPVPPYLDQVRFSHLVNQVRTIRSAFQPIGAQLEGFEKAIINYEFGLVV